MDDATRQTAQQKIRKGKPHEGPKNHLIVFVVSIVLTFLAFMAAANHLLSTGFVIFLLVVMAILQAAVQLGYWMHMKDRGHFYPILFILLGLLVALMAFAFAIYWTWW